MDDQIIKLAEETLGRYNALTEELSDPGIFSDQRRYREVAKEQPACGAEPSSARTCWIP
jgi:peptide chain release factor 1